MKRTAFRPVREEGPLSKIRSDDYILRSPVGGRKCFAARLAVSPRAATAAEFFVACCCIKIAEPKVLEQPIAAF